MSLRLVADGNFVVVDRTDGRQTILAEVDYASAALTLYEGAIYLLQSQPYQVETLDWPGRKAFVTRTTADYYTDAIDFTKLKVLERFDGSIAGQGTCHHGEVHVVRRVSGYKKIRFYSHENVGYGPVNLPDQELQTSALWWQLPQAVLDRVFASREDALDGCDCAAGVFGKCRPRTSRRRESDARKSLAVPALKMPASACLLSPIIYTAMKRLFHIRSCGLTDFTKLRLVSLRRSRSPLAEHARLLSLSS